jgi:L-alanine-DL-glutamate epimerase-like enolase superfamily enzyme
MDSLDQMVSNLHFGLAYTPLIKIKVNADVAATTAVLGAIVPAMLASPHAAHCRVSVDANSAWSTPEVALSFLEVLRPYAGHIAMVEQPYPLFRACPPYVSAAGAARQKRMLVHEGAYLPLEDSVVDAWARVADAFAAAGLPIYADESICTAADMRALRPTLHGVNIKLEKAGGYRRALCLLCEAQAAGVRTWFGCMVGSSRNSSQAAHLLPLATPDCWGDLDGSLLTSEDSDRFKGGMIWMKDGKGSIAMDKYFGTAVIDKQ